MMTFNERQEEIKKLQEENKEVLSTPLMSEGNISPYQVGLMSQRQKIKWQNNAQERMQIESKIRLLNRTDEEIKADEEDTRQKKINSRIIQIDSMIETMSHFIGKNGKILPKYAREINKLNSEKTELIKS